jgi:putative membrane protein
VRKATEGGLREIEAGKLASEKASSIEIRAFAKHMVDTHTRSNAELKAIVSVTPSSTALKPSAEDTLGSLSGAAFDRAYMTKMVQDHQAAIDLFEAEVRNGRDTAVKQWANVLLPAVRGHWQNARVLHAKVTATTTTAQ